MEVKFDIEDTKVQNFTEGAKKRIKLESKKYTGDIISEAEKVEEYVREDGASAEITENIVFQAIRRSKTSSRHKKKWWMIVLKILSELFLFVSGLLFNQEKLLTDLTYFCVFSVIFISALIITIIMHVKDGE